MLLNQTINLVNLAKSTVAENYLTALKATVNVFNEVEPVSLLANLAAKPAAFTFIEISKIAESDIVRLVVKHTQSRVILCIPKQIAPQISSQNILLHGIMDSQSGLDEYLKCLWQLAEGYFYFSDSLQVGLGSKSLIFDDVSSIFRLLSSREREVLSLLAEGLTNQEISEQLFVSTETIKNHKTNIMEKLKISNNNQLLLKVGEIRHLWREQMQKIAK